MKKFNFALMLLIIGIPAWLTALTLSEPNTSAGPLLQLVGLMPAKGIDVKVYHSSNVEVVYNVTTNMTPTSELLIPVETAGTIGTIGLANMSEDNATSEEIGIHSINVSDQEVVNSTITVAEVVSSGPGWVAVYNQSQGQPNMRIGYSLVRDGINRDVQVRIDQRALTGTLSAMLHQDLGQSGLFEDPGPDAPQLANGRPVMMQFEVTSRD